MKVIVAGSRGITDYEIVKGSIEASPFIISEIVSGGARGVDRLGERWAEETNCPYTRFPAEWHKHGRSAGYIRNTHMANYADALIAIWDGHSPGTRHMIKAAREKGLEIFTTIIKR